MKINHITDFDFNLGYLEELFYLYEDNDLMKIIFRFKDKDLIVTITDLDELELFMEEHIKIINEEKIKKSILLGKKIMWSWALTNQQGYNDAFQFEFINDKDEVKIQLLAIANRIKCYSLKEY